MRNELVKAGYCVSPNNIHGFDGLCMYPAGPDVPEMSGYVDIVASDKILVIKSVLHGEAYTKSAHYVHKVIAEYDSVTDFFNDCDSISEGGQPAHPQNWN